MQGLTYKKAGVDIHGMDAFKRGIGALVRTSFRPEVLKGIGGFGSFFDISRLRGYRKPVLVSSTDGVGTKLKIAFAAGIHDTVGIDAVAMNVNDILCTGAQPLFFLDYIAFSDLSKGVLRDIVRGITRGCVESGCALIGGETAQMPGMYPVGEYDVAGFCTGVVEKTRIIDGGAIRRGDLVLGLASSGIHSNGYSLVRKVFSLAELRGRAREFLRPTRIYVKPVRALLGAPRLGDKVSGIAHITGGAFFDKIARILPKNVDALIRKESWPVPSVFCEIKRRGGLADQELYHTLNMGIGMVLFVRPAAAARARAKLAACGVASWVIGEAVQGQGKVTIL
jgi:phosphoribosylformylglycinamidine cyclo-ligase